MSRERPAVYHFFLLLLCLFKVFRIAESSTFEGEGTSLWIDIDFTEDAGVGLSLGDSLDDSDESETISLTTSDSSGTNTPDSLLPERIFNRRNAVFDDDRKAPSSPFNRSSPPRARRKLCRESANEPDHFNDPRRKRRRVAHKILPQKTSLRHLAASAVDCVGFAFAPPTSPPVPSPPPSISSVSKTDTSPKMIRSKACRDLASMDALTSMMIENLSLKETKNDTAQ